MKLHLIQRFIGIGFILASYVTAIQLHVANSFQTSILHINNLGAADFFQIVFAGAPKAMFVNFPVAFTFVLGFIMVAGFPNHPKSQPQK